MQLLNWIAFTPRQDVVQFQLFVAHAAVALIPIAIAVAAAAAAAVAAV